MEKVDELIEKLAEKLLNDIEENKISTNESENVRALATLIIARAQMN